MKARIFILVSLVLFFSIFLVLKSGVLEKKEDYQVYIDGEKINTSTVQSKNGKILLPLQELAAHLHTDVDWNEEEKTLTLEHDDDSIVFFANEKVIEKDGKKQHTDVELVIEKAKLMVPLRFFADVLGFSAKWEPAKKAAIIDTDIDTGESFEATSIPILMYHHFADENVSNAIIPPHEFEEQMHVLHEQGYNTIHEHDLLLAMEGKKPLPEKPVLITIDDGYESNYIHVFPVLKQLNMKATIYLIVKEMRELNTTPYKPNALPKLSWEQIREMYQTGLVEFQGHTYEMHIKGKTADGSEQPLIMEPIYINGKLETEAEYEERVLHDIQLSKSIIEEKVGNKVISLAYPFGGVSEKAIQLLQQSGYKMALTTNLGANKTDNPPYRLNRINVGPGTSGSELVSIIEQEIAKLEVDE